MSLYSIYSFCNIIIFLIAAHLIALCCICIWLGAIKFIFPKLRKGRSFKNHFDDLYVPFGANKFTTILICLLSSLVILFSNNYFMALIGSEDIRTLPSGTYCYYVYATNEKDKTYTLPANIEKINNEYYVVHNVYFKNGGYLYFEDCEYFKFTQKESTYDQNGNNWDLKLTNIKTTHERVKETNPKNVEKITTPIIEIFIIILTGIMYIICFYKKKV